MENNKRYKVKELADILGMTTQTLRRYDSLGIISPERSGDNDYRMYKMSDLIQLLRLKCLRNMGFGLQESCGVYDRDLDSAVDVYGEHIQSMEEQIALLRQYQRLARAQRRRLEYWKTLRDKPFELRKRPACRVFLYRNIHQLMDYDAVKEGLRPVMEQMPPMRSCVIRRKEDLEAGRGDYQGGLFAFVSELEEAPIPGGEMWMELPECTCLVTASEGFGMTNYRSGQQSGTVNQQTVEATLKLLKENGFALNGDLLGEVLHMWRQPEQKDIPKEHNFKYYTIVWIPVKPRE